MSTRKGTQAPRRFVRVDDLIGKFKRGADGELVQVKAPMIPLSRTTLWHLRSTGGFPAPTLLGRTLVWAIEDIERWMAERMQASAAKTAVKVEGQREAA